MSAGVSTDQNQLGSPLTGHIGSTVAGVSVQIVIWETGPGHQPGCLSNDLRSISVAVAVDAIEHLPVAVLLSDRRQAPRTWKTYQMTAARLLPGNSLG